MLDFGSASSLLKIAQIDLQQNPLAIFGVLLDCCQQYIDLETQNLNIEVLATGENMQGIYSRNMAEAAVKSVGNENINEVTNSISNSLYFNI